MILREIRKGQFGGKGKEVGRLLIEAHPLAPLGSALLFLKNSEKVAQSSLLKKKKSVREKL